MRAALLPVLLLMVASSLFACGTTDADRIDEFVRAVTGDISRERVARALDTYVNLEQQSLVVSAFGDTRVYDRDSAATLKSEADRRLASLYGKTLSVLRRKVEIASGEAYVDLQLFGRQGMLSVRYVLVKRRREGWLLSELSVAN